MKDYKKYLAPSAGHLKEDQLARVVKNILNLKGKRIIKEDGSITPVIKSASFSVNRIRLDYETKDEKGKGIGWI